jgi:hypothetical protein
LTFCIRLGLHESCSVHKCATHRRAVMLRNRLRMTRTGVMPLLYALSPLWHHTTQTQSSISLVAHLKDNRGTDRMRRNNMVVWFHTPALNGTVKEALSDILPISSLLGRSSGRVLFRSRTCVAARSPASSHLRMPQLTG